MSMTRSHSRKRQSTKFLLIALLILCSTVSMTLEATPPPQRIISLAPNITEMIYRIQAGDRLIGRTAYCQFPPAALAVPTVGGYLDFDLEKVAALKPDLICLLPNPELQRKLSSLGFATAVLPDETIDEITGSILQLGEMLQKQAQAAAVVAGIEDTLQTVKSRAAGSAPVSTLLLVGRTPGTLQGLYAAGRSTYLGELLTLCGATNVFDDVPMRYFDVSKEELIQRDPQVIIELSAIPPMEQPAEVHSRLSDWKKLPLLRAVRENSVFVLPDRYFLIPGPRVAKMAIEISDLLRRAAR